MYGWTFNINDSASGVLSAIVQNMKSAIVTAVETQMGIGGIGAALNETATIANNAGQKLATATASLGDAPEAAKTVADRVGDIALAALDVQRAYEFLSYPLEQMPERWIEIRGEIVNTAVAINQGDWAAAGQSIGAGLETAMGTINDFRTSWQFAKEGFAGAKTIFKESWSIFSQYGMTAITTAKSFGSTMLFETLPSILTFVGRGVTSMAGFVMELIGATGAQAALNTVMLANPIGLIVVGVIAVGAAVAALIYYWDDVKGYLVDFTNFFIQNNPFMWIVNLVDKVFPNFKVAVQETFKSIFGWIDTWFIQPISKVMSWLGEQIEGITNDVSEALKSTTATVEVPTVEIATAAIASDKISPKGSAFKMPKQKDTELGIGKAQNIEGGGANIKTINIRIDKLVEKIENHYENASQTDERKIREAVTRALIDGVNDFNRQ